MNKKDRKAYSGKFHLPIWEKLQEIKEVKGLSSDMSTIEYAIISTHERAFPAYVKNTVPKKALSPEDRARRTLDREDEIRLARRSEMYKDGEVIAEQLNGEIIEHAGGNKTCVYNTYDLSTPTYVTVGEAEVPLDQLNQSHIDSQYRTDLEGYDILRLQETIKSILKKQ